MPPKLNQPPESKDFSQRGEFILPESAWFDPKSWEGGAPKDALFVQLNRHVNAVSIE